MQKNIIRKYYLANVYVIDCTTKDDNDISTSVRDRLKPIGKYIVSENINGGYFERLTGKRLGSLDLDLIDYDGFTDGIDFPNIFVDDNSKIKLSGSEIKEYMQKNYFTDDSGVLEAFFHRTAILNGMLPKNVTYFKGSIVTLLNGYEEAYDNYRDCSKYAINHGEYLLTKLCAGVYLELMTGRRFGLYRTEIATKHRDPHYFVYRIYNPNNPTMFVDEDNIEMISNNDIFSKLKEISSIYSSSEINEIFSGAKQIPLDSVVSDTLKDSLTLKTSTKKDEKE